MYNFIVVIYFIGGVHSGTEFVLLDVEGAGFEEETAGASLLELFLLDVLFLLEVFEVFLLEEVTVFPEVLLTLAEEFFTFVPPLLLPLLVLVLV